MKWKCPVRRAAEAREMQADTSDSEAASPVVPRVPEAAKKKKKSRGARLSKAERQERQNQRAAAASGDAANYSEDPSTEAFIARHEKLLLHVSRAEWNEAGALGGESVQLSEALMKALQPLGRHRLTAHLASNVVATIPAAALAHLVTTALNDGHVAYAAALARGLGLTDQFDLTEPILQCYESGRLQEAADALSGDSTIELRTFSKMLKESRATAFALQHAPVLRQLQTPEPQTLAALGAQARALAASHPSSGGAASLAETVRRRLEGALRSSSFQDARLHIFGSVALNLSSHSSDIDICALLPSHPEAHCRDVSGRSKLATVLNAAADAIRTCQGVSGLQVVPEGRTPLLRFEFDDDSGGSSSCASVELCFNNTDGLANTYVMKELMQDGGPSSPLHALASVVRHWARRRGLCGQHNTLNSYSWTLLAAYSVQLASGSMPIVNARSEDFSALLLNNSGGDDASWRSLARSSLVANTGGGGVEAAMQGASCGSPQPPDPSSLPLPSFSAASSSSSQTQPSTTTTTDAQLGLLIWHFFFLWACDFPYRRKVVSLRTPHECSKSSKGWYVARSKL